MKSAIAALIRQANSDFNDQFFTNDVDEFTDKLLQKSTMWFHVVNGTIVGFIAYYDNDPTLETAFGTMMVVDKSFKGKGLGRILFDQMVNSCKQKGFKNLSFQVHKDNTIAYDLYLRSGFKVTSETEDKLFMTKEI